ncbi:hypothetical protein Tco_0967626, partial [Tanacetum coccineum]
DKEPRAVMSDKEAVNLIKGSKWKAWRERKIEGPGLKMGEHLKGLEASSSQYK